jgi:hypothetical protein
MSISHRTNRLKLVGTPSVKKLQNGRYKLTVTCSAMNSRDDWYSANKARIFPDFGSLQSAEMSIDGLAPRTGEAYADMRLTQVESGNRSARDGGDYLVALTYETLGSSFVQVKDDNTDYELNGLRRVTRTSIAEAGTDYAKTVGSSYIDHQIDAETAVRCFLASYGIDDTDSFRQVQEVYVEAGVISVSTDEDSITDEVVVDAMNLNATQVRAAVAEVTTNHNLKSQSTSDFKGLKSFRYVFEIRSTTTETELGDSQIGVNFFSGIQTDGSSDFIIERQYSITSSNVASSIKKLLPPEINDPVFDGTGGTQKAYIVDQEVKPNGQDGAVLTRTFAMLPTRLDEWDEMVVRFPGVDRGPFQLDEGFAFRSQPYSEAVPVRMCREFFLSNPQRICRPSEFRPVDVNGNRVDVLSADTVPTADEYIGYVNSGTYLNDRVSIHRWQGDIWERRIVQFKAE